MKKLISLILALAVVLGMMGVVPAFAAPNDVINFPDDNLKAALIAEGVDTNGDGKITQGELAGKTTSLNLSFKNISNIEGLQYAVNLEAFDFYNNQISDISPLANLTSLTYLSLRYNQISDISPLVGLTSLEHLNLCDNQISDISPLANLTNLTWLRLDDNQISDIGIIANLTKLTDLSLDTNKISDTNPLANLTNLTSLALGYNQISDISPLANLTNLTLLWLHDNQISDISLLANLTSLTDISLSSNQISDISPLANLTNLTWLRLGDNQISDISSLANLTSLTWLVLNDNRIRDISSLANLTSLTDLSLNSNQISDISPLANLTNLTWLRLDDNQISDIGPLANLVDMWSLFLDNNCLDLSDSYTLSILDKLTKQNKDVSYYSQKPLPFTRQSGSTRITTALNIATQGWPTGAETVILTSGRGFADALAGGSLSASLDAPLLLTSNLPTGLEDDVLNTIKDLKAKDVVILGGTGTVSTEIESALKAQGLDVERRSGGNRYETAVDIATALYENAEFDTVFLADGNNYPDALAGAPVSGILGQPILFTNSKDKNVRDETLKFIEAKNIKNVVILGGGSSVSDDIKKALEAKNIKVSRIFGGNRYETALNIYNAYKDIFTGDTITITTGTNFPDALAGSAYSAKIGAPLFLLANTLNNANIRTAITSSGKEEFLVYGGSGSLSNAAVLRHVL
ncbi:MAG: leucine-rich repeat domain-containing protein [Oscillospiraceae bacterium]|jgi:internalin A|nr:leucine-rich repeat domain-containing protein [Oscillospiraceae bacterium]